MSETVKIELTQEQLNVLREILAQVERSSRDWSKVNPADMFHRQQEASRRKTINDFFNSIDFDRMFSKYLGREQSKSPIAYHCDKGANSQRFCEQSFYRIVGELYLSRSLLSLRRCYQNAARIITEKNPEFRTPSYRKVCRWASHEYRAARQFMKEQA